MARYTQTPITFGENPNTNREDRYPRYTNVKYPLTPRSINDIYILVAEGDRYDILAQTYYQDSSLWWIISTSNSNTRQDSLIPSPGSQIRIPAASRLSQILSDYENLNF